MLPKRALNGFFNVELYSLCIYFGERFFLNMLGVEIYQVLFCLLRQSRGGCLPLVGVGTVTLTDVCIEPSL